MQEELGIYIADLLYRHDRLSVPGLGSFEAAHAPALIDQVQGQVSAPAKAITFNENLVLDDGLLVAYLQRINDWSAAEALQWVEARVDHVKEALQRKEIVELPGVGRFFRNFEHQLKFVSENDNFNTDTYGLQPVTGRLIPRSREEKIPAVQAQIPTTGTRSTVAVPPSSDWIAGIAAFFQQHLAWIIGVAVAVLFVVLLLLNRKDQPIAADDPVAEVPQERLNASPSRTTPPSEDPLTTPPPPAGSELPPPPPEDDPNPPDTEAPTLAPEEHTAVIAVGLFGNPDNVQRMMERLAKDGYAPVSKKEGGNTRIGASIRFTEESELRSALRRIKRKYTDSAFVLSRDGKNLR